MLDRANRGPEPSAEILRAIRHGVAAGACRLAARATGQSLWGRKADEQSAKARDMLGHAAACERSSLAFSQASRRLMARSKTLIVTPPPP